MADIQATQCVKCGAAIFTEAQPPLEIMCDPCEMEYMTKRIAELEAQAKEDQRVFNHTMRERNQRIKELEAAIKDTILNAGQPPAMQKLQMALMRK